MQFDMCLLSLQPFVFEGQCAAEMCTGWSVTGESRPLDISTRLRADEAGGSFSAVSLSVWVQAWGG